MSGPQQRALHRVCGSVSGVKWCPTWFVDELMVIRYACSVCGVITSRTVALPCGHVLCEQCQAGSVAQDGGSVFPLDGQPFCDVECNKWLLPEMKKQNLEAYCWNEGCDFVGPLAVLLQPFEAECVFHVSPCQRCGEDIPNVKLAVHYISGCGAGNVSYAMLTESSHEGQAAAGDVTATAQGIEGKTGNRYEDGIPALQSQVNQIAEAARAQCTQLQVLNATLAVSLDTLNSTVFAAAEKLSTARTRCKLSCTNARQLRERRKVLGHMRQRRLQATQTF